MYRICRNKRTAYRLMEKLRDRDDTQEPLGYIEHRCFKTIGLAYCFDDITDHKEHRELRYELVRNQEHAWHGHTNGIVAAHAGENCGKLEDFDLNKPSLPDLVYIITQTNKTLTIAVPKGIIVLHKIPNGLVSYLEYKLREATCRYTSEESMGLSQAVLFCIMRKSGLEAYNASNWMEGAGNIGLWAQFIDKSIISSKKGKLSGRWQDPLGGFRMAQLMEYLTSANFKTDFDKTMELIGLELEWGP